MHNELWWGKLLDMLIWKSEKVIGKQHGDKF
jgi:hypothetical protein